MAASLYTQHGDDAVFALPCVYNWTAAAAAAAAAAVTPGQLDESSGVMMLCAGMPCYNTQEGSATPHMHHPDSHL